MDMKLREGALFEALNARKMSPDEIASSFVVSPQFDTMIGPDHSLLIGPRGSGKTTLLRMLEGQTLMLWEHERAAATRQRISYSTIFVPSDRLWSSQLSAIEPKSPEPGNDEGLALAAFGTQLLAGLVETLQYRTDYFETGRETHNPAKLGPKAEVELVDTCARAWGLMPATRTLNGLAASIDDRLLRIGSALEVRRSGPSDSLVLDELGVPHLAPMEAVRHGIRVINRATRQPDHRWALLLDEMELAPRSIHEVVLRSVRGGERNLILKMSFSPFDNNVSGAFEGLGAASPHNDFVPVYLWSGDRRDARQFADSMFRSMLRARIGPGHSPFRVLGKSEIDASGRNWDPTDAEPSSKKMELLLTTRENDPTFAAYLIKRQVDLDNLASLTYFQRSATVRKFYPIVVFRDALIKFEAGARRRRTRKKVEEVFSGQDIVYAALEGNPRWMKAVFGEMLSRFEPARVRVPYGVQYDSLKDAAERFESLLELLPTRVNDPNMRVLPLIDAIATHFNRRLLGEFSADIATTFTVDPEVDVATRELLRVALNAGAIVHIRGSKSPPLLRDLTGERFRITYLLSLRDYREIPMRLGKSQNLSRILENSPTWRRGSDSLFEWEGSL